MQRWTLEGAWGTAWFFWAGKTCIGEEHRTEAAEVTEGDAALDAEGALVESSALGWGRPAWGKASHRGHGGHRGGCSVGRRKVLGGQLGLGVGKTPACIKCLLVPGGRVLNPQSYHSAFRISSTRHEETLADGESPS